MARDPYAKKIVSMGLNGVLRLAEDPAAVPVDDFSALANLRYAPEGGVKQVSGFSRINATALDNRFDVDWEKVFALLGQYYDGGDVRLTSSRAYVPFYDVWQTAVPDAETSMGRAGAAGFTNGAAAYMAGGFTPGVTLGADRYAADVRAWAAVTDLPSPARGSAAGFAVSGTGYVCFGYAGPNYLQDCDAFDPLNESWSSVASGPLPARDDPSAASIDGYGYAAGGSASGAPPAGGIFPDCDRYDPAGDSWAAMADMTTERTGAAGTALSGRLVLAGGSTPAYTADCESYDPATDAWSALAGLSLARAYFPGASLDGKGYVSGGWIGGVGQTDLCEEYDPATDAWAATAALPEERYAHNGSTLCSGAL